MYSWLHSYSPSHPVFRLRSVLGARLCVQEGSWPGAFGALWTWPVLGYIWKSQGFEVPDTGRREGPAAGIPTIQRLPSVVLSHPTPGPPHPRLLHPSFCGSPHLVSQHLVGPAWKKSVLVGVMG